MKQRIESARHAWKVLSSRERWLLKGMALSLLGGLFYLLLWQPAQQRLADAERHYQQQLALARRVQLAQPQPAALLTTQPVPARLSERAAAAGLDLQQMDVDSDQVRLTISGEAQALLNWLAELEREGTSLQALSLEKRDQQLEARLVL